MPSQKIVIGARKSRLSLKQVEEVVNLLEHYLPCPQILFKPITTRGDRVGITPFGERGIFVKEIEEALLRGEIDLAVHSLKDLPTQLPSSLILASVPLRKDPRDVFISRDGKKFSELKSGAIIGTYSLRRKAQILSLRKDLEVVPLRGNIDTRIKKLSESGLDGIICSLCAVDRLGIKNIFIEKLPLRNFLPAPGQGALGIEVRRDNKSVLRLVKKINHDFSFISTSLERDFVRYLGGGCRLPLGAYARIIRGKYVSIEGMVANPQGSVVIKVKRKALINKINIATLGKLLAEDAIKKGALEILREVR